MNPQIKSFKALQKVKSSGFTLVSPPRFRSIQAWFVLIFDLSLSSLFTKFFEVIGELRKRGGDRGGEDEFGGHIFISVCISM